MTYNVFSGTLNPAHSRLMSDECCLCGNAISVDRQLIESASAALNPNNYATCTDTIHMIYAGVAPQIFV